MNKVEDNSASIDRLTTRDFWDSCYEGRELRPFNDADWRNYVAIQLVRLVESLQLAGKNVCEVGGGDAELTSYFSRKYVDSKFSVIDFSPLGCDLARRRALREGVNLSIHQADVFSPPETLLARFDLVISYGVVEHFSDLSSIMRAKKQLIHDDGKIFTLIPNFSSPIYAGLCKHLSRSVYEDHVPHHMDSFLEGHRQAGLKVVACDYLGAVEFGMLSMAMKGPEPKSRLDRLLYLWLTRFSKVIHLLEQRICDFPRSQLFSPFIFAVSVKSQ